MRGDSDPSGSPAWEIRLLGVKYRFYQRHSKTRTRTMVSEKSSLACQRTLSFFLNHPTRVSGTRHRGTRAPASPSPGSERQLWLDAHQRGGWLLDHRVKMFRTRGFRAVVAGHEFRKDTELYAELFTSATCKWLPERRHCGKPHLASGAEFPIVKGHWLRLIGMGGHGLVSPTPSNGQPTWIAYVGLQFLSDKRRRHGDE